jgi:hypothetical protein
MASVMYTSIGAVAFPLNPYYKTGKELVTVGAKFTVATTGNIGDQYVLAGPLSFDDRVARIWFGQFAALTSATTWNLGFYYSLDNLATQANLKPVVTGGGNELWSSISLATAPTSGADLLTTKNTSLDNTKAIRDLLNLGPDHSPVGGVYLVLTNITTANTAGGVIDMDIEIEEATTR